MDPSTTEFEELVAIAEANFPNIDKWIIIGMVKAFLDGDMDKPAAAEPESKEIKE